MRTDPWTEEYDKWSQHIHDKMKMSPGVYGYDDSPPRQFKDDEDRAKEIGDKIDARYQENRRRVWSLEERLEKLEKRFSIIEKFLEPEYIKRLIKKKVKEYKSRDWDAELVSAKKWDERPSTLSYFYNKRKSHEERVLEEKNQMEEEIEVLRTQLKMSLNL